MKITTRAKVMTGALVLAGGVSLTGGAFTASGVSNDAGTTQFIGGEVSQTVVGAATLSDVTYTFADSPANTLADSVQLTFSAITAGSAVHVNVGGDDIPCDGTASPVFDCDLGETGVSVNTLTVKVTEA